MVQLTTKVFIISAPSGAGKTTLVKALLQQFDCFTFSISATTRPSRDYEEEGKHYYFLSQEQFEAKRAAGEFLEWEEVYPGRFYGTLRSEVERILSQGKCPIFDVDVKGGLRIKKAYGQEAVSIFIQPPKPETLLERLQSRGSETEESLRERYEKSQEELAYAGYFDHIIINDVLPDAIAELSDLVRRELNPTS
jgi:guanylate kinase